jgi:outer membrane protein TolC
MLRRFPARWLMLFAALVAGRGNFADMALAQPPRKLPPKENLESLPAPQQFGGTEITPAPPSLLNPEVKPIDLCCALKLAGVYNPEILLARERITAADAQRQLAAAQILPNINYGTNVDVHQGKLQQSTGRIIDVNRDSLYLGLGANAVAAGTVNIPGITWNGNVSEGIYAALVARQVVRQRTFESDAVRNDVLLRVVTAYLELLRATGRRAVTAQTRADGAEMARITANFAATHQGRQADADRAAAELQLLNKQLLQADADIDVASARLAQLLSLDPSVRLHPIDGWAVPAPIVPDPIPLPELLAIALMQRPELQAQQAAIRAAFLYLQGAKILPFSPNVIIGYSNGSFGGGSNLASDSFGQARFGSFGDRQDIDAVVYWSLRNLGVGNLALIKLARSNLRQEELRKLIVLDRIRAEVAVGYARSHARYAQIGTAEQALGAGKRAFQEDLWLTRNDKVFRPIELLDSLRLMGRGRVAYLDAIIDYNRAQFELYVALGQPPACTLARPVPRTLVPEVVPPGPEPTPTPPITPPASPAPSKKN